MNWIAPLLPFPLPSANTMAIPVAWTFSLFSPAPRYLLYLPPPLPSGPPTSQLGMASICASLPSLLPLAHALMTSLLQLYPPLSFIFPPLLRTPHPLWFRMTCFLLPVPYYDSNQLLSV